MSLKEEIEGYLASLPKPKGEDMKTLHRLIKKAMPKCRLWYLDGRDEKGKIVSNPSIGYGFLTMKLAGGKSREFYQIGISANTSGISVYIIGIEDKKYLSDTYGKELGKASVSGYCIKFKALKDINVEVLEAAIRDGVAKTS